MPNDYAAEQALYDVVNTLCRTVEADTQAGVLDRELGARVWLMPRRIFSYQSKGRRFRLSAAMFIADTVGRPVMRRACAVQGGVAVSSSIRWSFGKGFIGTVLEADGVVCQDNDQLTPSRKRTA